MGVKESLASLLKDRLSHLGATVEASDSLSMHEEYEFNVLDPANRLMAYLLLRHQGGRGNLRIEHVCLGREYMGSRKGIGTKIVGCVEDLARQMGHEDIRINCSVNDRFWNKLGYALMEDPQYDCEWGKRIR